jgi:hypothetical protein
MNVGMLLNEMDSAFNVVPDDVDEYLDMALEEVAL